MSAERLKNYIGGKWVDSQSENKGDVVNPALGKIIAEVPHSTVEETREAIRAADDAFLAWRETPPLARARFLFQFKNLLEENFEDISRTVSIENGKVLHEARGSVRRGIEVVEMATGIPSLMQGRCLEDIAPGIDSFGMRQPLGVFAAIAPFNFPAMVPLWFLPVAIACGNTFVAKPSDRNPLSQQKIFNLLDQIGLPPGVVNLVNGARETVETILDDPAVKGVSFVGSSPVAKAVYRRAAENGKRVQSLGGAKNFIIVMPDADMEKTVEVITESCYGCAGERCLAGSVILCVGDALEKFRGPFLEAAGSLRLGNGLDEGTTLGPMVTREHMEKVIGYIERGVREGAKLILDGRGAHVDEYPEGYFLGASIFDNVTPEMAIATEEIFGPVVCLIGTKDLDEAIRIAKRSEFANASSIFTASGKAAREFRYRSDASMLGVNIGVAAPMAFFPFGGSKGSFFGDRKATGRQSIDFYTDEKVVISRWF